MNMLLLKALGKNSEGIPRSVKGVLDEATKDMRTIGRKPMFQPDYDPVILSYAWPDEPVPLLRAPRRDSRPPPLP